MAYTASALAFMLENLGKTVVVTGMQSPYVLASLLNLLDQYISPGSQVSIVELMNDARKNLITSIVCTQLNPSLSSLSSQILICFLFIDCGGED